MQIVATGQEPLPLRAWASIRLVLWYFGTQLALVVVIAFGADLGLLLLSQPVRGMATDLVLLSLVPATLGAGVVVLIRLRRNLPGGAWEAIVAALGWRPVPRRILLSWALCGGAIAYLFVAGVIIRFRPPNAHEISSISRLLSTKSSIGRDSLLILAIGIAPPLEEFLFRGVLLAGLGTSWGVAPAVFASAGLFALAHLDQIGGYWPAFVMILGLALLATVLRLRYRSLLPGIGLHIGYNAMLMALSFHGT